MSMKTLIIVFGIVAFTTGCSKTSLPGSFLNDDHDGHVAGGELKIGKYFGFITLDRTGEKIATVLDFYIVQPEVVSEFPKLNVSIRLALGGFGGREYISEVTEDIHYDYENGTMAIDSTSNDLVITAEVHNMQKLFILGDVWIQSAAEAGKLKVEFLTDEPDFEIDADSAESDEGSVMPALTGQYIGKCDGKRSALQIRTVRGLGGTEDTKGLTKYGISATLAFNDNRMCGVGSGNDIPAGPAWCSVRTFNEGTFNPYSGNLVLKRDLGMENCQFSNDEVVCRFRMPGTTTECTFDRPVPAVPPFLAYNRYFNLRPTADQNAMLPPPSPPRNTELMAALKGQFAGYLHNEQNNSYQVVRLNIVATTSTDNPHNENAVYVTPTLVMHFGNGLSQDFWVQRFNRRNFNVSPGFVLESENSESFVLIEDWRQGYIKAGYYSHSFGKIGSIHLVKASLPAAPANIRFVPSVVGEFEGPVNRSPATNRHWWFKTVVGSQPIGRDAGVFEFGGEVHFKDGSIRQINKGAYDVFTGAMGWMTAESEGGRMVMGTLDAPGKVDLLWPGASKWGVSMWDYRFYQYDRDSSNQ